MDRGLKIPEALQKRSDLNPVYDENGAKKKITEKMSDHDVIRAIQDGLFARFKR